MDCALWCTPAYVSTLCKQPRVLRASAHLPVTACYSLLQPVHVPRPTCACGLFWQVPMKNVSQAGCQPAVVAAGCRISQAGCQPGIGQAVAAGCSISHQSARHQSGSSSRL